MKHKRILKLFKINPYCYWCGCKVIYVKYQFGKKIKNNWTTLDHLRSRLDTMRGTNYEESTVLACWKCNNDRAKEEQLKLSKEELWRRSGRYPSQLKDAL